MRAREDIDLFAQSQDNCAVEGGEIAGKTARDELPVNHHLTGHEIRPGFLHLIRNTANTSQLDTFNQSRRRQNLGAMADPRDRPSGFRKLPH